MAEVIIIDTSVFLNVIDVPGRNQNRAEVLQSLEDMVQAEGISLLMPLATVIETGNHIAQIADGRVRRACAEVLVQQVLASIAGEAPWAPTNFITSAELGALIIGFPDEAMRGVGLADLTIKREWEVACELHRRLRVRVWSLDHHLAAYDRAPLTN